MNLLLFVLAVSSVIAIPGPNVFLIVSTSIYSGKRRGVQTAIGTSLAMVVQLFIAAPSISWIMAKLNAGYFWLKWLGIVYLLVLLISSLMSLRSKRPKQLSAAGSLRRGFFIGVTNPKTILLFCALAPQFINTKDNYYFTITLLSVVFWLIVLIRDVSYALLSDKVARLFRRIF